MNTLTKIWVTLIELMEKIWVTLIDWAEEINEYRRKNGTRSMY